MQRPESRLRVRRRASASPALLREILRAPAKTVTNNSSAGSCCKQRAKRGLTLRQLRPQRRTRSKLGRERTQATQNRVRSASYSRTHTVADLADLRQLGALCYDSPWSAEARHPAAPSDTGVISSAFSRECPKREERLLQSNGMQPGLVPHPPFVRTTV